MDGRSHMGHDSDVVTGPRSDKHGTVTADRMWNLMQNIEPVCISIRDAKTIGSVTTSLTRNGPLKHARPTSAVTYYTCAEILVSAVQTNLLCRNLTLIRACVQVDMCYATIPALMAASTQTRTRL